jgi:hypothetical protein
VIGTFVSILVGVVCDYVVNDVNASIAAVAGLALALLSEILVFCIDIRYGAFGEEKTFQDALRSSPVLRRYESCIRNYLELRNDLTRHGEMGQVLASWLDEKIMAHHAETDADWRNGRLSYPGEQIEAHSLQMQGRVKDGGFATQLERSTGFWENSQDYLESTRQLARSLLKVNKTITRVFILSSPDSLRNEALGQQIAADAEAGINVRVAYVADLKMDSIRDFGVWDNAIVSEIHMTPVGGRVTSNTYSMREDDVRRANAWKDDIIRHAMPPPSFPTLHVAAPQEA